MDIMDTQESALISTLTRWAQMSTYSTLNIVFLNYLFIITKPGIGTQILYLFFNHF